MKAEKLFEIIGDLSEETVADAGPGRIRRLRPFLTAAACLALVITVFGMVRTSDPVAEAFSLRQEKSVGIKVKTDRHPPLSQNEACLAWFSEEELFESWDTAIFRGTVEEIENIAIFFRGEEVHRALIRIVVESVFRGSVKPGDTVCVLSDCPLSANLSGEELISRIAIGTRGVFMPNTYSDTDTWSQNGATLYLRELADYGFPDCMRWFFLETEDGILYDRESFPSLDAGSSPDALDSYIRKMVKNAEK